ncbi:MAG: 3-deoxy-manno-octulosonate cytidylyltransferase [Gammaproteobacteria bacterium]|nr:3-deoxy-manno-octulosonate cytidylyltransferase [Gammaproteobacteria bacterium]|tara:strand:- start:1663 stop:2403 length:741 start_codon:yes stop_codon:yes gene_type:complete
MNFIAVIPARIGSKRLPGKPLLDIAGKPMIQHVYARALESNADRVLVATDDQGIADAVIGFGGECVMTRDDHLTGTDRLAEVADVLELSAEAIIVNVQGDEPLLPASAVQQVVEILVKYPQASIATLCEPIHQASDIEDPNQVKVVKSQSGRALYFSRAGIPVNSLPDCDVHYRHIGLYAYRAGFLRDFSSWDPTPLEQFERLEQLRALEHDRFVQVEVAIESIPPGVDTESDLEVVRHQMGGFGV